MITVGKLCLLALTVNLLNFFGDGVDFDVELALERAQGYLELFNFLSEFFKSALGIDFGLDGGIHVFAFPLLATFYTHSDFFHFLFPHEVVPLEQGLSDLVFDFV